MKFIPKIPRDTAEISTGSENWVSYLKGSLSIGLIILFAYLALGLTADLVSQCIPDRYEARFFAALKKVSPEDKQALVQAQSIFDRMIVQPGLRDLPYHLFIIPSNDPNAFAYPGGGVGLTSGLLRETQTEGGLAFVIGHELGHHQNRDAMRSIGRAVLLGIVISIALGDSADDSAIDALLDVANARHSQTQEYRADLFGLTLAHDAFGHRNGELEFFEKLLEEEKGSHSVWASFAVSHPYAGLRLERLKEIEKK
ncbi:MAG: hypothetical protein COB53_07470 [Elusimicrobia bacterium]|nr:MAG: hypothetical protein COB53_07470 [Elusimicrobiota bacterium]